MIDMKWEQPILHGSGYVHVDAAYWGRNWGILLAIAGSCAVIFVAKKLGI